MGLAMNCVFENDRVGRDIVFCDEIALARKAGHTINNRFFGVVETEVLSDEIVKS
jgi:hypothetical protein